MWNKNIEHCRRRSVPKKNLGSNYFWPCALKNPRTWFDFRVRATCWSGSRSHSVWWCFWPITRRLLSPLPCIVYCNYIVAVALLILSKQYLCIFFLHFFLQFLLENVCVRACSARYCGSKQVIKIKLKLKILFRL